MRELLPTGYCRGLGSASICQRNRNYHFVSGSIMGVLIDGKWTDGELPQETSQAGQFKRVDSVFRDRITADGASGFKAEPGRYHLYVAHGCPWAHRTLIYRAVKKLEGLISVAYSIPGLKQNGWTFERDPRYPDCIADEVNGFHYLYEAYVASNPAYTGKVTVPTLWDKKTKRIVNNESSEIIRMFNTEFNAVTGDRTDLYPQALRAEIDAVNERVYHNVNNGVYRAGFAKTQAAYEEAYDGLFETLDWLETRLSRQRYLVGGQITEADWRLFPTLVRFDVAYFSLFKCNRQRIADFPNLSNYMRDLYQVPGIAGTVTARYYVINYYSIGKVNPTMIVPKGTPVDFGQPHDRATLAA
jgi:glutathionyl-hydroquinone reductase